MKSLLWITILSLGVSTLVQARPGLDERDASPIPFLSAASADEGDGGDDGGDGGPGVEFWPLPQVPQYPEPGPDSPIFRDTVTTNPYPSSTASFKATGVAPPPPPPSPPPPPPATPLPDCRTTLNCTFDEIQTWTMAQRVQYVRDMQALHFGPLNAQNQFRAIEAVIDLFQEKGSGAVWTWVSYVDAGIVEAIQRGGGIALNLHNDDGGNPASRLWLSFFSQMKAGQLADRDAHDRAWSMSEGNATEYGRAKAEARGLKPIGNESYWYNFTRLYRTIMKNRAIFINGLKAVALITDPAAVFWVKPFVDWLTDVTDYQAAKVCLEISWTASQIASKIVPLAEDSLLLLAGQSQPIMDFIWELVDAWRKTVSPPSPPPRSPKAGSPNTN